MFQWTLETPLPGYVGYRVLAFLTTFRVVLSLILAYLTSNKIPPYFLD